MKRLIRVALIGSLLGPVCVAPACARAQNRFRMLGSDLKFGALDIFSVWVSPFRGSLRGYGIAAASLGAVGAISIADEDVAEWFRTHQDAGILKPLAPFREASGSGIVNSGAGTWYNRGTIAVYGVGLVTGNLAVRDIGMGCLTSGLAHSVLRQAAYGYVARERPLFRETVDGVDVDRPGRPYVFKFGKQDDWYHKSFFAGHVANVTSCMSFIDHRFRLGYARPVLWAFASGIALGRMADQRHYASDIALGGLIGFAVGKVVGERSRDRAKGAQKGGAVSGDQPANTSWRDGLFVTRSGTETLLGWRGVR